MNEITQALADKLSKIHGITTCIISDEQFTIFSPIPEPLRSIRMGATIINLLYNEIANNERTEIIYLIVPKSIIIYNLCNTRFSCITVEYQSNLKMILTYRRANYNSLGDISQYETYDTVTVYGNKVLHNTEGPAIEWADGHKEWWVNGERHRIDGPAIEWTSGGKTWYVNGKCIKHEE